MYKDKEKGIFGTDRELTDVAWEKLNDLRGEFTEKQEGEKEKSPEIKWLIEGVTADVMKIMSDLGLNQKEIFSGDLVHIVSSRVYKKITGKSDSNGAYDLLKRTAVIKDRFFKTNNNKLILINTIVHEIIHAYSFGLIHVKEDKQMNEKKDGISMIDYRSGFKMTNTDDHHRHFRGINEAITQMMASEIISKHDREIEEAFGLDSGSVGKFITYIKSKKYGEYEAIIKYIAEKVDNAKDNKNDFLTVIKKGYFSGSMMFLRDIEKTFGLGTIRVLAGLGQYNNGMEGKPEHIMNFLKTDDPESRSYYARHVLNDSEYEEYKKIVNT